MTRTPRDPAAEAALAPAWARLAAGGNAAVIGDPAPAPPAGSGLLALPLDCAMRRGGLGLVRDALARIGELLQEHASHWLPDALRADPALRRRLLDEAPERVWGSALIEALQRLGSRADGRAVLVFENADAADAELCELIAALLPRSGLLRVPMLLAFGEEPREPGPRGLLEGLRKSEGGDAVVSIAARREQAPDATAEEEVGLDALPPELLRVLRALAVASPDAEPEALASLLGVDPIRVLEELQSARDHGFAIVDRGHGRLSLPAPLAEELRATLLPSLARAYHRGLAEWHATRSESADPGPAERDATQSAATDRGRSQPHAAREEATARPEPPAEAARPGAAPPRPAARRIPVQHEDAASHAEAAGESEIAAGECVRALAEAVELGLHAQALELGSRALALLERPPASDARRRLRVEALRHLARVHWEAAGLHPDLGLEHARDFLAEARELLAPGDPPELSASLDALLAHVLYDVGSREALDEALGAVTRASRTLMDAGDALRAARLLNDEAAIWVRLGDPVRANALLTRSLDLFGGLAAESAEARLEAAETEHLIARLVFHVPARAGRGRDALEVARQHAQRAEQVYDELARGRELARVRETLGRLEQRRGDAERADAYLRAAAEWQQQEPDPIGLARTAGALAELCAARGQLASSLELLAKSVELNAGSGSPVGLAYNRRALEALGAVPPDAAPLLARVREQLERAESVLGRMELADPFGAAAR